MEKTLKKNLKKIWKKFEKKNFEKKSDDRKIWQTNMIEKRKKIILLNLYTIVVEPKYEKSKATGSLIAYTLTFHGKN